jgi:hypothetical protein
MIPEHLKIQPGQEALSPEQEAEARRFVRERIAAQLSAEPVDESETEALLQQAYEVAGLAFPRQIIWLDGPLAFCSLLHLPSGVPIRASQTWSNAWTYEEVCTWGKPRDRVYTRVGNPSLWVGVDECLRAWMWEPLWKNVAGKISTSVRDLIEQQLSGWNAFLVDPAWASVRAYPEAADLAVYHFFAVYDAHHEAQAEAQFNELVSGYWLGKELALLVRRPHRLALDGNGHLHSASGKCVEYPDGWGFYAWHGLQVPERVILAPERLSRDDFLHEPNVEVRRVIQARMGERFVSELGGTVIDTNPRGTLYEAVLPEDDPERVARYIQVQDASTVRRSLLRVPPTLQTAAKALAWTFQVAGEDYRPAQET